MHSTGLLIELFYQGICCAEDLSSLMTGWAIAPLPLSPCYTHPHKRLD
jgi:hypothetical protein